MRGAASSANGTFSASSARRVTLDEEMAAYDALPAPLRRAVALGTIPFGAQGALGLFRRTAASGGEAEAIATTLAAIRSAERREMTEFARLHPSHGSHLRAGASVQTYAPWRRRRATAVSSRALRALPRSVAALAAPPPAEGADWYVAPILTRARIERPSPPDRVPFRRMT
jgi:hypothetical protein